MRISPVVAALGLSLAVTACSEQGTTAVLPIVVDDAAHGIVANGGRNAAVPLSGDAEVPARDTRARGTAIFHFDRAASELSYKLIVANIENVVQAHIHVGSADGTGPFVAFLYGPVPAGGGGVQGVLAQGTITAANLVGPLAGQTMADLMAEILSGNAYVNVHTNDGVDPANTGPGDFPGGEIRGQIR